jgi:hypothetical protein
MTEPTATPAPARRRWLLPALAGAALILVAGTAATTWMLTRDKAVAAAPVAATPARSASPECVAIDRAYHAWDNLSLPQSVDGFQLDTTEVSIRRVMEDGDLLYNSVDGYTDQAAKDLTLSVAEYNVEVSTANLMFTVKGEIERDQAVKVMTALEKVRSDYVAWRKVTCA